MNVEPPGMFESLCSFENLYLAYRKAAKGKRGQPEVSQFEFHLEENLFQLREALLAQTYQPGGYRSFYIRESKRRLVSAAPFCDRVAHHALCRDLELVSLGQYAHVAGMLVEIGRLLGGWQKSIRQ